MGSLSISSALSLSLAPRHSSGGTPTPTPAPSFSVQPSITGTPQVGVSFVGTPGTASNTTSHSYRWLIAATSGGTYTAISGATSASYTPVSGDETKYLKFEDTATGPGGSTVATTTFAGPVAASGIGTPVIHQLSTTGVNPFEWYVDEDATFMPGYYWHVQRATGADTTAATTNLLAGTLNGEAIQQITVGDLSDTGSIVFTDLTATPTGSLALRLRVGREDGSGGYVWSSWSNVLTDTIAEIVTPAEWVSTTGVGKSQYVTVSGTPPLVVAGQAGFNGAPISVRATQAHTGKRQFQITVTSIGTSYFWIGVDDGTTNFNSGFVRPGKDNSAGISIKLNIFDGAIYVGGSSVQTISSNLPATGDVLTVTFDESAGTVSVYRTRSGTTVQIGTAQAVTMSAWYANAGAENADTLTALFGTGQARTLDSGYSTYDG